jgi:hypothetical protein
MMHKGASSKSVEEDEMETAEDSTCKLPFITQELVIVDRSVLKQRIPYKRKSNVISAI